MFEIVTPAAHDTTPFPQTPFAAGPVSAPSRGHAEGPVPARTGHEPTALHAAEQFALASEILAELFATDDDPGTSRPVLLPALTAIGLREPRAVAAAVARDALNRTAELSVDLPDSLADAVLEDVVRTARLLDSAVER